MTNTMPDKPKFSALWWSIFPAVLVAIIANILLYYFATRILNFELLVPNEELVPSSVPLPLFDVILFSILWALAASIIFFIIVALSSRPILVYVTISTIVLVLSFGLPLMMPADKVLVETKVIFILWHIIGAVSVVGILVTMYRRHLFVQ